MKLHLQLKNKTVGWWFMYPHDGMFQYANLLPKALPEYTVLSPASKVDFVVLVYPTNSIPQEFVQFPGMKFMVAAEPEQRMPALDNCFNFVNAPRPDDPPCNRYSPLLSYWVPPISAPSKTQFCSTVDSGKWPKRAQRIVELSTKLGPIHAYGGITRQAVGGYHGTDTTDLFGNAKYRSIVEYAFYLSLESAQLVDYWTEKLGDAILCDTVPIYEGAPNIYDYFIPESLILTSQIDAVDWRNWQAEYSSRQKYVAEQKQLLLRRFNLFSYFDQLTSDLSLLDRSRPLVR